MPPELREPVNERDEKPNATDGRTTSTTSRTNAKKRADATTSGGEAGRNATATGKETKSPVLYKIRVLYRRLVIAERLYKTPDFVPKACKTGRSRARQQTPPDGRTKATRAQAEKPNATRRTHETGKPRKGQARTKRHPTDDGEAVKPAQPVICLDTPEIPRL